MTGLLDGDWGNNSDKAMAAFAALALVISVGHVLWDVLWRRSDEKDWQVKLQNAQNNWQSDFESKLVNDQRAWEAEWRKEETGRLKVWREEDIARQEASFLPKLSVGLVRTTSSAQVSESGLVEHNAIISVTNTGQSPVFLKGPGGFEFRRGDRSFG
jgi:hypothetical protein